MLQRNKTYDVTIMYTGTALPNGGESWEGHAIIRRRSGGEIVQDLRVPATDNNDARRRAEAAATDWLIANIPE